MRYLYILHTLDKLQDSYYQKEGAKEIRQIAELQS